LAKSKAGVHDSIKDTLSYIWNPIGNNFDISLMFLFLFI
jgi:hypothetical protein